MHSSFSWSQQEQLINRIEEPNSVYTHFLIMIIDNLRDELENEIDLLERSTKQDYIDLKKKEITVLNKSRDMATNALKKHIEKTNLDLEESIQSVAFYDKKLENLKLERLHIIDLEKEKNSTLRNSKFSAEKMILDEIFKYVSKLISKDQLILKKNEIDEAFNLDSFLHKLTQKSNKQTIQLNELTKMIKVSYFNHKEYLTNLDAQSEQKEKSINADINLSKYNKGYALEMIEQLKEESWQIKQESCSHHQRIKELEILIDSKVYEIESYSPTLENPTINTKKERLENLEKICEEKTPLWENELKSRKAIVEERSINEVFHFTDIKNLDSILKHGLLSREIIGEHDINFTPSDLSGPPQLTPYISTSISFPNYKMLFSKRMADQSKEWVLLAYCSDVLCKLPCYFTPTNASNKISNRHFSFNSLFNFPELRDKNQIKQSYPTDPQAEVLFYRNIDNKFLRYIYCENSGQKQKLEELYPSAKSFFKINPDLFLPRNDHSFWTGKDYFSLNQEISDGN